VHVMTTRRARLAGTMLVCAGALFVAGCGSDDSDSGTTSAGTSSQSATTAAAPAKLGAAELAWATKFTGGQAGKADPSKPPFVIGFANQQGGSPSYPHATDGAQAAVKFINDNLGGIDGRPIQLKTCFMLAEEDGQKCGAEFLADDKVQAAVLGLAAAGNASFYKTVVSKLPVLVATAAAQPDMTTPGVYTLNGGSFAPIAADALLAAKVPGAKQSAVLASNNPIGTYVSTKVLKPILESEGLKVALVPISDTATAPEVASAIQASGAASAQVFQMTTLVGQCVSAYDALKQQNITPTVVTTYQCSQPDMYDHLDGKAPANWQFTGFGDSPRISNAANGQNTYVAAMKAQGQADGVTYDAEASYSFSTLMALTAMSNKLGAKAAPATIKQAILDFRGPLMMTPGVPRCGQVSKQFPGICTTLSTLTVASADGVEEARPPIDVKAIIK
jgi:branched-chain amino acid transport system substrate-binding protein